LNVIYIDKVSLKIAFTCAEFYDIPRVTGNSKAMQWFTKKGFQVMEAYWQVKTAGT